MAISSELLAPADAAVRFYEFKEALVSLTGLSHDGLHVHIGLVVFFLARLSWRGRRGWVVAWVCALIVALGGEWLDWTLNQLPSHGHADPRHWHDIWNTMLWPTLLLLAGPHLLRICRR